MIKLAARFEKLPPYTPIEPYEVLSARMGRAPAEIIKMDANENPYGMSPKARQALAEMRYGHIYPDPESRILRAALAEFTRVPAENLMAGAGADELIDLLLRVLLEPGDAVLNCPPTFGMYAFDTRLNNGQVIDLPRQPDFSLDLPALYAAVEQFHPKVLFLTSPNNPDGRLLSDAEFEAVIRLPLMVVLDEAYIEFASSANDLGGSLSRIGAVMAHDNLVVLRTFSKWAGLAGLRVGYGAFPAWIMPVLWKAKQPYNVNVAASLAALASLNDLEYLSTNVERLKAERQRLYAGLSGIPYLEAIPSRANFILCRVKDRSAPGLKENLAQHGILLRYYNTPLLKDFIRASVGLPEYTGALVRALEVLV